MRHKVALVTGAAGGLGKACALRLARAIGMDAVEIDAGVDIYHCSIRRFWEPEFEGSDLNLAGWTKKPGLGGYCSE